MPSIDIDGLKKPRLSQYAVRFAFGALITALTAS